MENNKTQRPPAAGSILFCVALVAIGIVSRVALVDFPNFNLAMPIAMLIGYAVVDRRLALPAVISMMGISDWLIGFYDWRMMVFVYFGFAVAWTSGIVFRRWIDAERIGWKLAGVLTAAVVSAIAFFLITNSACCLIGWYPLSWSGLATSLSAGLPFFRSTLASTVFFSLLIFGTYFAAQAYLAEPVVSPKVKRSE